MRWLGKGTGIHQATGWLSASFKRPPWTNKLRENLLGRTRSTAVDSRPNLRTSTQQCGPGWDHQSRQLEKSQQWDNPGNIAGDEGFPAFLESRKKRHLHKREGKQLLTPRLRRRPGKHGSTSRDSQSYLGRKDSRHTHRRLRNAWRPTTSRNHCSLPRTHASKTHGRRGWIRCVSILVHIDHNYGTG